MPTCSEGLTEYKNIIRNRIPYICPERALLVTDTYKNRQQDEPVVKRAEALDNVLRNMTVYILPGEFIVGNQASSPFAAPLFPEYSIHWLKDELDRLKERKSDRFLVKEEDKEKILSIVDFWAGKTHYDRIINVLPEDILKAQEVRAIWSDHLWNDGDGHIIVDYERVLKKGLKGILAEIEEKKSSLKLFEPDSFKKSLFYSSLITVCKAISNFAKRFSSLAFQQATEENNQSRKRELLKIAEICRHVPFEPASTFYEALQSLWFIHLVLQIESNGHSVSLGRFDQYMYSFYKKDISKGVLTDEQALLLIKHFWIRLNSINKIRPWTDTQYITGYPMFQNVTIGGQNEHGRDAVNELSYMCLKATRDIGLTQPSLSARYHGGTDEIFLRECARTIRYGYGMPAMFNDEVIIPAMLSRGVSLEDSYNYAVVGCVEVSIPGKWGYRCNGMSYFNLLKVFELSLNDGRDPATGIQLCKGNGSLDDFKSIDDVIEAWNIQIDAYLKHQISHDSIADYFTEIYMPDPCCSMLVNDCIKRGKPVKEGGAVYDIVSGQSLGFANIINSLSAIKTLVFEKKLFTPFALKKALDENFEGEDSKMIRQIILSNTPEYGNDIIEIDNTGADLFREYARTVNFFKNNRHCKGPVDGGWCVSTSTVSANIPFGRFVGATPDGRLSGAPLADGISPSQGTDCEGPTAAMNSVARMPNILALGGQMFNMKFSRSILEGESGLKHLISLIKVYFARKGWHVQFNVINRDTLLDAVKNPDLYRDLIVRVAGYSARFVELDPDLQQDIIRRTEHTI